MDGWRLSHKTKKKKKKIHLFYLQILNFFLGNFQKHVYTWTRFSNHWQNEIKIR